VRDVAAVVAARAPGGGAGNSRFDKLVKRFTL